MNESVTLTLPAGLNPLETGDAELAALVRNLFVEHLNAELLAAVVDVDPDPMDPEEFPTPVLTELDKATAHYKSQQEET